MKKTASQIVEALNCQSEPLIKIFTLVQQIEDSEIFIESLISFKEVLAQSEKLLVFFNILLLNPKLSSSKKQILILAIQAIKDKT